MDNDMAPMHMTKRMERSRRGQRGVVLFISLMFLIVMTLIGITAMSGAGLQEKMAGNMRDKGLSFEAAEAALRDAETDILSESTLSDFNELGDGLYVLSTNVGQQRFEINNWTAAQWQNNVNTHSHSAAAGLTQVVQAPRFYIEQLPPIKLSLVLGNSLNVGTEYGEKTKVYHRVTARGVGQTDTAVTILQSTYLRD